MANNTANPLSSEELIAFVAAVESASVQGAADALGLTQSAVTKRLQGLERRGGVALLERGRFGVRPTAAGRLLYPDAKEALAALRRAEEVLGGHRELARHALRLAASYTVGELLLPGWLAAFRRGEPDTRAQVEIVNSAGVLERLREREVELGFVEGAEDLSGFDALTVQQDQLGVVVAAGHAWCRRGRVQPLELAQEPYVAREEGSGTRDVIDAELAAHGIRLVPAIETASVQSVKRTLAADGGFSLLSPLAVELELSAGTLALLPLEGVQIRRALRAVRAYGRRHSDTAESFWRWLERNVAAAAART
jgi:DNA-binding transcriptional LysR family regulator